MSHWYQVFFGLIAFFAVMVYLTYVVLSKPKESSLRVRWSAVKVYEVLCQNKGVRKFVIRNVPENASVFQVCSEPGIPWLGQPYYPDTTDESQGYVPERITATPHGDGTTWEVVVQYIPLAEAA